MKDFILWYLSVRWEVCCCCFEVLNLDNMYILGQYVLGNKNLEGCLGKTTILNKEQSDGISEERVKEFEIN